MVFQVQRPQIYLQGDEVCDIAVIKPSLQGVHNLRHGAVDYNCAAL